MRFRDRLIKRTGGRNRTYGNENEGNEFFSSNYSCDLFGPVVVEIHE